MPAEIDTGGPTVLHCDYRADCDCPIALSARTENSKVAFVQTTILDLPQVTRAVASRRGDEKNLRATFQSTRISDKEPVAAINQIDYRDRLSVDLTKTNNCEIEIGSPRPVISSHLYSYSDHEINLTSSSNNETWTIAQRDTCRSKINSEIESSRRSINEPSRSCGIEETGHRNKCSKSRSYFRLAFLLLAFAFGQSGLLKSSVLNCCAIARGTAGLSVLTIGTVISAVSAAPVDLTGDAGVRAERSANLSHITGASRKIQMYIKNRHLQILPDGTVNGSNDDTSDYTIFQRTSVSRGQLRIQGVATCLYLCMDSCGLLYGSREYTEDCVFNETLEQHNYNTYSSIRWSTGKKTLYLGLNRRGQPRRVQAKGHNLGRLSAYARVLTQVAAPERVETLQSRMMAAQHNSRHRHNSHRHHHHREHDREDQSVIQQSVCPSLPSQEKDGRDRFRCRKRKKRKKRRRKCRVNEKPGPQCQLPEDETDGVSTRLRITEGARSNASFPESKRSCEGAAIDEACRREALSVPSNKRKLRVEDAVGFADGSSPIVSGRNLTSNGKPPSIANKLNVTGSMSRSKKPNLTDGKKKKKPTAAAAAAARRNPSTKKLGSSALATSTTVPIYETSSSYWWYPGASTGRGYSRRRKGNKNPSRNVKPTESLKFTVKVPEDSLIERTTLPLSSLEDDDDDLSISESTSEELITIEATTAPSIFRLIEEESGSSIDRLAM